MPALRRARRTPEGLVPIGKLVEDNAVGTKVFDAHGITTIVAVKRQRRQASAARAHQGGHHARRDGRTTSCGGRAARARAGSCRRRAAAGDQLEWHRPSRGASARSSTREIAEAALAGWLQSDGFVGQYEGTNRSLTIEAMTVTDARAGVGRDGARPRVRRRTPARATCRDAGHDRSTAVGFGCTANTFGRSSTGGTCTRRGVDMRVPEHLFEAPLPVVTAYLRSLFQAEGYVSQREQLARSGST